jgi:CubicO group peptidase (beta-lactamase class C family)
VHFTQDAQAGEAIVPNVSGIEDAMTAGALQHSIEELIEAQATRGLVPPDVGVAVAVVQGTTPIYLGAYGLRDRDQALPVTTETLFDVSSATKAFTATALLDAHQQGRLDLYQPINRTREVLALADPT